MIGANAAVIAKAEERDQFKAAMERIGLEVLPRRDGANLDEARRALLEIGLPCVVRPSFTLGGTGSSHRLQPRGVRRAGRPRPGALAGAPGAAGRIGASAGKNTRWR